MTIDRLIGYDNNDSLRKKQIIKVSDGSVLVADSIVKAGSDGKLPQAVIPENDDAFINALIFGG